MCCQRFNGENLNDTHGNRSSTPLDILDSSCVRMVLLNDAHTFAHNRKRFTVPFLEIEARRREYFSFYVKEASAGETVYLGGNEYKKERATELRLYLLLIVGCEIV